MSNVRHMKVSADEHEALVRLLAIAERDTHQSRRVADFLLAWWNAGSCGAFDITSGWPLDEAIQKDLVMVFALALRAHEYPDTLGYGDAFKRVVHAWRPELKD